MSDGGHYHAGGMRRYLKRLPATYYHGTAWVHWTMTIEGRRQGWLDELIHARVREALLQTFARYALLYECVPVRIIWTIAGDSE